MATGILALPHGMHRDVPSAIYHERVPGMLSSGALQLAARSPAHLRAWLDGTDSAPTPALVVGQAFHCATLEPERFARDFAAEPDFGDCRKKENKAARDAWRAANAGAQCLPAEDHATVLAMRASVLAHPIAGRMILDGVPELTVRWRDPETGLPCKLRTDYYVADLGMAVDLKSTEDAGPKAFARSIAEYGYHLQNAHYANGFDVIGAPLAHFVFVAVEKAPPYGVAVYSLDVGSLERGHARVRALSRSIADCVATNHWPCYPETIQQIELPPWAA